MATAYAVRKNGYAVRCNGYAQDTDSSCCGSGALFCQAKDCCSTRLAWFPVAKICNDAGACIAGKVINFAGACWEFNGLGPFTEEYIHAHYARQRIYAPSDPLDCYDGCDDSHCPDCPTECCFIQPPDPFCTDPADCECQTKQCVCGKEWTVSYNYSGTTIDRVCFAPTGSDICVTITMTANGSVSWRYTEVSPGLCDLQHFAVSGTGVVHVTSGPDANCTQAPLTFTTDYNATDFAPLGCGSSPGEMIGLIKSATDHGFWMCLYGEEAGCTVGSLCNASCGAVCDLAHRTATGAVGCLGGNYHKVGQEYCDISCSLSDSCVEDFTYTVSVNTLCEAPPPDIDQTGGSGLGPPPAGSFF